MSAVAKDPEKWLVRFGLSKFRQGQKQVIDTILDGHDTLCIMPTGGGKSLCYQLPAIARDGVTIVISPLIALMKDQVDSLNEIGIPATVINSTLTQQEQYARIDEIVNDEHKLVYIAPERLRSSSFMRAMKKTNIQLLAVDEAHCISHWGHDFRPDYARLGSFREKIGNPQTIALTATATTLVQDDICKVLNLSEPKAFVTGFGRENLRLTVEEPKGNVEKDELLIRFLKKTKGCGIVYASTRKNCEKLIELLKDELNRKVAFYHAGLPSETRKQVQNDFMSGELPIIVATNAFGMGIDKADLRFVVHYNLPGSVEAYYQEAGRAGRDGKPSECLLLYSFQDKFIQEFFIENSYPAKETIEEVYEYLRSINKDPIEMTLQDIKEDLGLSIGTTGIANCENLLELAGAIERLDSRQNMAAIKIDSNMVTLIDLLPRDARVRRHVMRGLEELVKDRRGERVMFSPEHFAKKLEMKWPALNRAIRELNKLSVIDYVPPFRGRAIHMLCREKPFSQLKIDFHEFGRRKNAETEKLTRMIRLATTRSCRQLEILEYFGDSDPRACRNCDNCGSQVGSGATPKFADNDACLYVSQVALSGAARTHGRIGKNLLAQMLKGSTAKKVQNMSLHRLPTFGLLSLLRQSDITQLIDWLVTRGYLQQNENTKFRPLIQIAPAGKELMLGAQLPELIHRLPAELVSMISMRYRGKQPHVAVVEPESDDKHEEDEAEDENEPDQIGEGQGSNFAGEEPASDAGSEPVLTPDTDNESEQTATAESFMATPAESALPSTENVLPRKIRLDLPSPTQNKPSYYWTWHLLNDGYSVEHLQQLRQINLETIYDHATQAVENRLSTNPAWLLSESQLEVLETLVSAKPTARSSALIAELPSDISAQQLIFFLKCRAQIMSKSV